MQDRNRLAIGSLLFLMGFTVLSLFGMTPGDDKFSFPDMDKGYSPTGDMAQKMMDDPRDEYFYGFTLPVEENVDEYGLDEKTLNRFMEVYMGEILEKKDSSTISEMNREELRLLLGNMGSDNIIKLKEILSSGIMGDTISGLKNILDQNLFYEDIIRLNKLMDGK